MDLKEVVEVDEDARMYGNCCLVLALGRAVARRDATAEAARDWVRTWVAALPDNMRGRLQQNESRLGEAMFDDYVEILTRSDDQAVVFMVATDGTPSTKIWAGNAATSNNMRAYLLKLQGFHFTTLFPKDDNSIQSLLPRLPPIEIFSYVGPAGTVPES